MNFWKSWTHAGVSDNMDFRLSRRIILSNQFAFLIALITSGFMVVFAVRGNFNLIPFIALLFISVTILILNYLDLTRLSRWMTCLTPACGLLVLNLSLKITDPSSVDILHYATPRMLILGSSIIPFALFTAMEKRYVWSAVLTILSISFSYDLIHQFAGVNYRRLGLTTDHYDVIYEDMVIFSVMILVSSGFMFNMGHQYDLKSQRLLNDAIDQAERLRRNEEDMKRTMRELEESRKKDGARNWVSRGLSEIIAILQSGNESSVIFDNVLSALIRYSEMNQGTMFIATENESGETVLQQVSCYAYDRKKYTEKIIEPGNGIIGQVYLEGELCYMRSVPESFVRITSGLGEATPRYVVIIPMKLNKTVEGILELASFQPLDDEHFELFNKLGETLASFIATSRVNDKTRDLLYKAQLMSEELKANEEEMRQNLEELTATQEVMARKEHEYQRRIEELERSLETIRR